MRNVCKATKVVILSIIASIGLTSLSAEASNGRNENKAQEKFADEFKTQDISQIPSLPELPQYTGQGLFGKGIICPNAKGGTAITYSMTVREGKQAVMQWYQDSLKLYKWTMDSEQTPTCLRANKGTTFVQVSVAPASRMGYGADVMIMYRTSRQ